VTLEVELLAQKYSLIIARVAQGIEHLPPMRLSMTASIHYTIAEFLRNSFASAYFEPTPSPLWIV
jgi:hypothetical protein